MKKLLSISILLLSVNANASILNFDALKPGKLPTGWQSGSYANQGNPKWEIAALPDTPSKPHAVVQTGKAPYAWAVNSRLAFRNGAIELEYSILEGKEDPEAGLVWRQQDPDNYYYVRANALENNLVFYRMLNGKKERLKEAEVSTPFKTWHKLKIEMKNEELKVYFDGKLVLNTRDATFSKPGKVGFFTTADTHCAFDNLAIMNGIEK